MRLAICALVCCLTCAIEVRADLVATTPLASPGVQFAFFDEAARGWFDLPEGRQFLDGWVSRYGVLNGGQFFFTDLFDDPWDNTASLWWDFSGTPLYYGLNYIDVWGLDAENHFMEAAYYVSPDEFRVATNETVSLPEGFTIHSIAFYGQDKLPEPSTLVLTAIGLLALVLLPKRYLRASR